jgi:hypothetical protein
VLGSCHASGGELEQIQFLLGTSQFKPPNDTLAASSAFDQQSMIALASSPFLELGATVMEEWPTILELARLLVISAFPGTNLVALLSYLQNITPYGVMLLWIN